MNRIQLFREKAGLSQAAFSKHINSTQAALSHYENGVRTPSIKVAIRIVTKLNELGVKCTLDDLFLNFK